MKSYFQGAQNWARHFCYVVSLFLMATPSLRADDHESDPPEGIEEVVVTASYLGSSEVGDSGNARILDADALATSATLGLGDALDDFLGVSVTDFGSAVSRPTIRGLTGDRVAVLNNGMRARDVSGLGADHSMDVDLFNAEQIEVIKGPASLLYTKGAIGGVINVVDNTIAASDFTASTTRIGMETQSVNNGQVEFFSHQSNVAGLNFNATYNNAEFENFEVPKGALMHEEHEDDHDEEHGDDHDEEHYEEHGDEHEEGPIAFLSNSDYSKETTRFGVSKVADWGHIGVSYAKNEGLYGIPFHQEAEGAHGHDEEHGDEHDEEHGDEHDEEHADEHGGHDAHEDERITATTESDIINLSGSLNVNGRFLKNIDYHFRDTDYTLTEAHVEAEEDAHEDEHDGDHEEDEHAHEGPTTFTNEAQEFGAVFDVSTQTFTQKIALEFVSEDVAIMGEEAFMNPASTDEVTLGYYASREFGGLVFDFGIRNDWVDRSGSVAAEEEHDEDEHEEEHDEEEHHDEEAELQYFDTEESVTSYGLQISRQFNETMSATINLASVERAPAAVELFMNGPHLATGRYEVGNPNLDTEKANSAELLLDYAGDTFFGSVSVFTNDIDDYIYLRDETEAEHEEHAAEHADDHGGLISASYRQQDAEFVGYEFEIGGVFPVAGGDLTLSFGLDSVSADFSDNTNVPRINPDRSIYTAAYSRGSLDASIVLKDVDGQSDTALTEAATAGYTMLNMNVTNVFSFTNDIDLTVSVFGRNLMDEIARNHSSFVKEEVPLPGRSYGLKFYATF